MYFILAYLMFQAFQEKGQVGQIVASPDLQRGLKKLHNDSLVTYKCHFDVTGNPFCFHCLWPLTGSR